MVIKHKRTYTALHGLSRRLVFSLSNSSVDPTCALSSITFPVVADLLAALLLERLCQQLRKHGFPFTSAETGRGRYAGSISETTEMSIVMTLARVDEGSSDPSHYELEVSCQRPARSRLFETAQSASPSDQDYGAWETLQKTILDALRDEFGIADLS